MGTHSHSRRDQGTMALSLAVLTFAVAACGGAAGNVARQDSSTTTIPEATTSTAPGSTSTTSEQSATTTPGTDSAVTSLGSPAPVGEVVAVGDWRVRVSGVEADATESIMGFNEFNEPPAEGQQFFVASLEATYVGGESSDFWADLNLKAVGPSNVAYEPFDAYCGLIPDDINESGEVFSGGTITGNVCWVVDEADAGSLVMVAEEFLTFDNERQFLSLDPGATPVDGTTRVEGLEPSFEPMVARGTSATVGAWELTVIDVIPDGDELILSGNQFNDPPADGNQFYVVVLEATYVGEESSDFWVDMTLKAVGDSHVAYEPFTHDCGFVPDDINDSGETFPGGTISGNACWEVSSEDVSSLVMIGEDFFSFEGDRVFFELGG